MLCNMARPQKIDLNEMFRLKDLGMNDKQVAEQLGVHSATVGRHFKKRMNGPASTVVAGAPGDTEALLAFVEGGDREAVKGILDKFPFVQQVKLMRDIKAAQLDNEELNKRQRENGTMMVQEFAAIIDHYGKQVILELGAHDDTETSSKIRAAAVANFEYIKARFPIIYDRLRRAAIIT